MEEAIVEARRALRAEILPVGCVIAIGHRIIARAHRLPHANACLDHAEMLALRKATHGRADTLSNTVLYTTLEPCAMCFGAIVHSGVSGVVFALDDPDGGCTRVDYSSINRHYGRIPRIVGGVSREAVRQLMKEFFIITRHPFWSSHKKNPLVASCIGRAGNS